MHLQKKWNESIVISFLLVVSAVAVASDSVHQPADIPPVSIDGMSQHAGIWKELDGRTMVLQAVSMDTRLAAKIRIRDGRIQAYDSTSRTWEFQVGRYKHPASLVTTNFRIIERFCIRHRLWEPWVRLSARNPYGNNPRYLSVMINPVSGEVINPASETSRFHLLESNYYY